MSEVNKGIVTATPEQLWEPAQPGETLENVWIPNRRERRKMLRGKGKKKNMRQLGKLFNDAEQIAKDNPGFKKEIYKALYENLKAKTQNIEEELEKKNLKEEKENENNKENEDNGTNQGN